MSSTIDAMRDRLSVLEPLRIDIIDDSAKHAGHSGAGSGGHFRLDIVARSFTGKSAMTRHRMVYHALGSLMQQGIHALSIDAKSPEEL